jgi:hypothetical protein
MRSNEGWPTATEGVILGPEGGGVATLLAPPGALPGPPLDSQLSRALTFVPEETEPQSGRGEVLGHGTWTSPPLLSTPRSHRGEWPRLHRFVDLSALGWAFVLAAVCWEAFAFAFNHYAGWGWDRGAFFFAWGLGILACGFYLRTTRKQPADSRLFLGLNALFLSVLTIVVVTR